MTAPSAPVLSDLSPLRILNAGDGGALVLVDGPGVGRRWMRRTEAEGIAKGLRSPAPAVEAAPVEATEETPAKATKKSPAKKPAKRRSSK